MMRDAFKRHWRHYLAEAAGLGFFMVNASWFTTLLEHPGSPAGRAIPPEARLGLLGIWMGLVVALIVYSPWGKKSGAHINPAVTWAFYHLGRIKLADALWYTLAQFAGALVAVQIMGLVLGAAYRHPAIKHVVTVPGTNGPLGAWGAEFFISFVLMIVILVIASNKKLEKWAGALIGVLLMFYLTVETPWSGMSLNPARTFASAFAAREWEGLWVYFTAPTLAMLLAVEVYVRWKKSGLKGPSYPVEDEKVAEPWQARAAA